MIKFFTVSYKVSHSSWAVNQILTTITNMKNPLAFDGIYFSKNLLPSLKKGTCVQLWCGET